MTLLAHSTLCDRCCDEITVDEISVELDDDSTHFHADCAAAELADRFVEVEVLPS